MNHIKHTIVAGAFFVNLICPTNLMADDMNEKIVIDQSCFGLLSLTLAKFGEQIISLQNDDLQYRYEISCKENELEIYRFQKSAENSHFVLPRGGGDHFRTFSIENGKAIETTSIER